MADKITKKQARARLLQDALNVYLDQYDYWLPTTDAWGDLIRTNRNSVDGLELGYFVAAEFVGKPVSDLDEGTKLCVVGELKGETIAFVEAKHLENRFPSLHYALDVDARFGSVRARPITSSARDSRD